MLRYVTIGKFSELCGLSEAAIRSKLADGTWPQDIQWVKAPDGRIMIDSQTWLDYRERQADVSEVVREALRKGHNTRTAIDNYPGIYVLYAGDLPVYVGMATSIAKRIAQHIGVKDFDSYATIRCDPEQLADFERQAITLLKRSTTCAAAIG